MIKSILLSFFLSFCYLVFSQEGKVKISVFDGALVAGYVDGGGYVNFTGPSVNYSRGKSKLSLGMLPSIRMKKDTNAVRNSFFLPTLGFGLTYSYSNWTIQIPCYYNLKTASKNGAWVLGVGLGYRFNFSSGNKK